MLLFFCGRGGRVVFSVRSLFVCFLLFVHFRCVLYHFTYICIALVLFKKKPCLLYPSYKNFVPLFNRNFSPPFADIFSSSYFIFYIFLFYVFFFLFSSSSALFLPCFIFSHVHDSSSECSFIINNLSPRMNNDQNENETFLHRIEFPFSDP